MANELMSEDEANTLLDRLFTEKFGRTFREPLPSATPEQPDTLEKILADYPLLFGEGPSGTA